MASDAQPAGLVDRLLGFWQVIVGLAAFVGWVLRRKAARRADAARAAEADRVEAAEAARRKALDTELREAQLELSRRLADYARFQLIQDYGQAGEPGFLRDPGQRARRAAVLLEDVQACRKRFWTALGMPDPDEPGAVVLTSAEKQALLGMRQTMRFRALELPASALVGFIADQQAQELVPVPDAAAAEVE